ncbi:MAG TPA: HAMP domain-containing sensor histidine kinase, partial [Gemmataceae bacterium]|nr:HAMP domain-containing sensor histidine kinase [Gemmataceae bacterium]
DAERRLGEQLWRVARTLLSEPPYYPITDQILHKMKGLSGAEFLFVSREGIRRSTLPGDTPPPDVPPTPPTGAAEEHPLGPPVAVGGTEYRCLRLQLREPDPNFGGDLYIFYPESLRRTAMWDAARPLIVLGGLGGLIAVGLAVVIGSRLVHRVRELEHRTRLIAEGDFRPMPLPAADDELKDLCRSVNEMARRLTEFQDALQRTERLRLLGQFSGGLAHQLRNAAAGAKLAVELFLAENPSADPEPLQVALRQLGRIESNLRQFLDLGKPPAGVKQPCDLVKLIDQAVSLLKPQCQHAGIALAWEPAAAAVVNGDPAQLSHLFGNVIGNAVEAAGAGGSVSVHLATTRGGALVEVTDTGPGPPAEIAGRLFEPFVTGKEEGIGLGLAVAKQAAEAHGGRISWERQDGRTVFRIELPSAPRA